MRERRTHFAISSIAGDDSNRITDLSGLTTIVSDLIRSIIIVLSEYKYEHYEMMGGFNFRLDKYLSVALMQYLYCKYLA